MGLRWSRHPYSQKPIQDVDVNIAPRTSLDLQDAIRPHLDANKNEAVLVNGKTPEAKAAQRNFRIFKSFEGLPQTHISENECVMLDSAFTEIDGIMVATVPLMVVFKIGAMSRQNRSAHSGKAFKGAHDLAAAVKHLRVNGELVPAEVQALFSREIPPFSWTSFWEALTVNTSDLVETLKVELPLVGIVVSEVRALMLLHFTGQD